jgi:hypothetical protein
MKTVKNAFFLSCIVLIGCNNQNQNNDRATDTTTVVAPKSSLLKFKDAKQERIFNAYLALKDNLVQSKNAEAKKSAGALADELEGYKGCETAALSARKIASAVDLKEQRKNFNDLNIELIAMFNHVDLNKGSIYVQHCPMANNGNGGDWLATEKKIQNPYYGSEMMECGAVVSEIKAK